jgi:hypothetical protein
LMSRMRTGPSTWCGLTLTTQVRPALPRGQAREASKLGARAHLELCPSVVRKARFWEHDSDEVYSLTSFGVALIYLCTYQGISQRILTIKHTCSCRSHVCLCITGSPCTHVPYTPPLHHPATPTSWHCYSPEGRGGRFSSSKMAFSGRPSERAHSALLPGHAVHPPPPMEASYRVI